jgi:hypothetical protein
MERGDVSDKALGIHSEGDSAEAIDTRDMVAGRLCGIAYLSICYMALEMQMQIHASMVYGQ